MVVLLCFMCCLVIPLTARQAPECPILSLEGDGVSSSSKYFTIGITGARGVIGSSLVDELVLRQQLYGKPIRIVRMIRGQEAEPNSLNFDSADDILSLLWNPNADEVEDVIDPKALQQMDAIVHMSGEDISTGLLSGPLASLGIRPWTDAKKEEILNSRVVTTTALAKAIAASGSQTTFLVASGIGAYGHGFVGQVDEDDTVDESADISQSDGFLAEVTRQWEAASFAAKKNGNRVVNLRIGVVLSTKGGALAKMYPVFNLGLGGKIGSGEQYFPFVSIRDTIRALIHILETPALEGPVNICAPGGVQNSEFTRAMGTVLRRPTILPLPAFVVSLLFGEMGEEVLLGGTRANPTKLLESGFQFEHVNVEGSIRSALLGRNL